MHRGPQPALPGRRVASRVTGRRAALPASMPWHDVPRGAPPDHPVSSGPETLALHAGGGPVRAAVPHSGGLCGRRAGSLSLGHLCADSIGCWRPACRPLQGPGRVNTTGTAGLFGHL